MLEDYQDLRKKCWAKKETVQEFYSDKVQFGAISTVLKPDKPVRFAIKGKLIRSEYLDLYGEIRAYGIKTVLSNFNHLQGRLYVFTPFFF